MLFGDYRDTRHYFWYIQFEKKLEMQWGFEPLTSPLGTPFLILPQCSNTVAWAAEWASNMDDTLHAHFVAFFRTTSANHYQKWIIVTRKLPSVAFQGC